MIVQGIARHPYRGWGLAALAVLAFGLSIVVAARQGRPGVPLHATAAESLADGQRLGALRKFAALAASHGLIVRPVDASGSADVLARVDGGAVDFALVQGGIDFSEYPNIRQVVALQVLPLHAIVKEELAEAATRHLAALRGKSVLLGGGRGTGSYRLARDVLAFAGLELDEAGQAGDYAVLSRSPQQLAEEADRGRLPDAALLVAPLPNVLVAHLIKNRRYRLVPLPFRDAFAMTALLEPAQQAGRRGSKDGAVLEPFLLKEHVVDALIPAFTYPTEPGAAPADVHTLGISALLVANRRVSPDVVGRVLDVLFQTRYAKIVRPPLDLRRLAEVPEVPWHQGSIAYLRRSQPVFTGEFVSQLVNIAGVAGPLLGGILFLWQWVRQRSRLRREQSFEAYIAKVSALERRALDLEESESLDRAELTRLWRELGRLKSEALAGFARGKLTGDVLMTGFLTHVNDARSLLAHLLEREDDRGDPA